MWGDEGWGRGRRSGLSVQTRLSSSSAAQFWTCSISICCYSDSNQRYQGWCLITWGRPLSWGNRSLVSAGPPWKDPFVHETIWDSVQTAHSYCTAISETVLFFGPDLRLRKRRKEKKKERNAVNNTPHPNMHIIIFCLREPNDYCLLFSHTNSRQWLENWIRAI